jgi:hypothetical protein
MVAFQTLGKDVHPACMAGIRLVVGTECVCARSHEDTPRDFWSAAFTPSGLTVPSAIHHCRYSKDKYEDKYSKDSKYGKDTYDKDSKYVMLQCVGHC